MNRGQLEHLSSVLLELHKVLIDSVKTSYERERGQVSNPFELLRLLTSDPFFDWLRPLSRMLADFDELLERTGPLTDAELGSVASEVRSLLEPSDEVPTTFSERYLVALQEQPAVILAHGKVARALATMPLRVPASPTLSQLLAAHRAAQAARRGRRN